MIFPKLLMGSQNLPNPTNSSQWTGVWINQPLKRAIAITLEKIYTFRDKSGSVFLMKSKFPRP